MRAVLRKELRSLLRERRGWLVPVLYTSLLSAVVGLLLRASLIGDRTYLEAGPLVARVLALVQTVALFLIAPLVGAATIAGERERGTFSLLLASPVSRPGIVLGKATAAVLYTLVVLVGSLPLGALSLFLGGPDAGALVGFYLSQAIEAAALVALGVAVSTLFHRTWSATLVAIGLALALTILTAAACGSQNTTLFADQVPDPTLLAPNPAFGAALFLAAGRLGGTGAWLAHQAAQAALAGLALGVAVARIRHVAE